MMFTKKFQKILQLQGGVAYMIQIIFKGKIIRGGLYVIVAH